MEHGIHCLPCSYTINVIDLLPLQRRCQIGFEEMSSGCHYVKVLKTTVGYSLVAIETVLCHHLNNDARVMYAMLLSSYK